MYYKVKRKGKKQEINKIIHKIIEDTRDKHDKAHIPFF